MDGSLDHRLVPEVHAVEHADRQVHGLGGQPHPFEPGELEDRAHRATLGAAS
jgi:hypothetical protein